MEENDSFKEKIYIDALYYLLKLFKEKSLHIHGLEINALNKMIEGG